MKVGDIVRKRRDYIKDHAFQRMPVGYIVSYTTNGKHLPTYEVKWFKTGNRTWKVWLKAEDLIKVTKPLNKHQQRDVLT